MLRDLLLQDIDEEPEDGDGPTIRRGTSKDRIVSTTDPEMRHGRKSHSTTFNGYKASVVAETDDGVILATDVRPGNTHDKEGAVDLVVAASKNAKAKADSVLGDTAYGSMETRRQFSSKNIHVVAKAVPPGGSKVEFTIDQFKLSADKTRLTCPQGKQSIRRDRLGDNGWNYVFSRRDCNACPTRSRCTRAKVAARAVGFTEDTHELRRLRAEQHTADFRKRYRRRVIVEHCIGRLVQIGIRQARYIGKAKTAFQVSLAAAVANLRKALHAVLSTLSAPCRLLLAAFELITIEIRPNPRQTATSYVILGQER